MPALERGGSGSIQGGLSRPNDTRQDVFFREQKKTPIAFIVRRSDPSVAVLARVAVRL
jgi:hypothetical protein